MEFRKCERCGCFFASNDNVCYNCLTKDRFEMSKFKTFIEENNINTNTDIIKAEFLPDNLAISIYQNEEIDYDITVLGYINRREKWIKLKFVTDYVTIYSEDD